MSSVTPEEAVSCGSSESVTVSVTVTIFIVRLSFVDVVDTEGLASTVKSELTSTQNWTP